MHPLIKFIGIFLVLVGFTLWAATMILLGIFVIDSCFDGSWFKMAGGIICMCFLATIGIFACIYAGGKYD